MDSVIGHEHILSFFEKVSVIGRLHHAYCFIGPEEVGKRRVAAEVAARIIGVPSDRVGAHPNYLLVQREKDEDGQTERPHISIEQVHALRRFAHLRSFDAKKRVAVIDDAERLTPSAASALLKTLEEPGADMTLILIAADEDVLPQTIRSRCHAVYFSALPIVRIRSFLEAEGVASAKAAQMADFSFGLPGRAIRWQEDPASFDAYKKEAERFQLLIGRAFFEKRKAIDSFFDEDSAHADLQDRLRERLALWKILVRDAFFMAKGYAPRILIEYAKMTWRQESALRAYNAIRRAEIDLPRNTNPRLVMESVLLALP